MALLMDPAFPAFCIDMLRKHLSTQYVAEVCLQRQQKDPQISNQRQQKNPQIHDQLQQEIHLIMTLVCIVENTFGP